MSELRNTVNNHDVVYVNDRLTRFITEMIKSVSSGIGGMISFDQARLGGYLDAVDSALDYITAQPQLDLPESHPSDFSIKPLPERPDVESDEVDHIVRLLYLAREELVNSQSARLGAGLLDFDSRRVRSLVAKTRAFLTDYVAVVSPLDLPETSPMEEGSGAGNKGI